MARSQLLAILLLLLLSGHHLQVESLPLPFPLEHQVRQNAPPSAAPCVLNGNSDLYGLGIRLGVYFQLISTLLANHFLPDALREAWDANTIFLISIFVAVLKSSVNVNNLTAPEAFVMLQMLFAFLIAVYHIGQSSRWLLFEICASLLKGTMEPGLGWAEMVSELGQAQSDVSQLGTTMRQFLALAIASYNVWFWFAGNDFLDIDRHCISSVFVFARVDLHGNARIFFQVLAVLYLLYQVYRLAFVDPILHLLELWIWKAQRKLGTDPDEPKPTWKAYFLGLFDPVSLIEKEKVKALAKHEQQKHDTEKQKARQAVENGRCARGLVAHDDICFKPILHHLSVKNKQKHEPEIRKDSGIWKYRLSDKRCAIFNAKPPGRRWSFSENTLDDPVGLQKPKESRFDKLAPVYPILKEDERTRRGALAGIVVDEPDWDSSRWLYWTKAKSLHIFHSYAISTRNSHSDLTSLQRSDGPKPHPARDQTLNPLSQKKFREECESNRTHWYWSELLKLGKAWGNQKTRHTSRLRPSQKPGPLDGDPDRERCFWLPDDVDTESFNSVSMVAPDTDMDPPVFRRWSFDEKDVAYLDHGDSGRPYPFITGRHWEAYPANARRPAEPGVYVPRTDSRSTSSYSSESSVVYVPRDRRRSSRSPSPRRSRPLSPLGTPFPERTPAPSPSISPSRRSHRSEKSPTWLDILGAIAKTVACIFNTIFLCAPFTALSRKFHKDHATRLRSKQFPRKASHIRKYPSTQPVKFKYSSGSSRRRTRCGECDRDFNLYDRRRRWRQLTAEIPRNRSLERAGAKHVFAPLYTVDVVFGFIKPWVEGKKWWEKVRAFGRYEVMAGLTREDEDEDGKRGRRRSGDGGERRGVQEGGKKGRRRSGGGEERRRVQQRGKNEHRRR